MIEYLLSFKKCFKVQMESSHNAMWKKFKSKQKYITSIF